MTIESTKYHVGCGIAGIYAGTMKPSGDEWRSKSEVTHEAMAAVAQYMVDNKKYFKFKYGDKTYLLYTSEVVDIP